MSNDAIWLNPWRHPFLWLWHTWLFSACRRWFLYESPFTRVGRAWRRWLAAGAESDRRHALWHALPQGPAKDEAWAWCCRARRLLEEASVRLDAAWKRAGL